MNKDLFGFGFGKPNPYLVAKILILDFFDSYIKDVYYNGEELPQEIYDEIELRIENYITNRFSSEEWEETKKAILGETENGIS